MNQSSFKINKKIISNFSKPYVIAEIGSNFDQSLEKAYKLISIAKNSGANAVKFQLFDSNQLYNKKHELYKIFMSIELNKKWIKKLKIFADYKKLDFILSVKIASSEVTNYKLLHKLSSFKKALILSTGMSDSFEIDKALNILEQVNETKISILHCSSLYPCKYLNT